MEDTYENSVELAEWLKLGEWRVKEETLVFGRGYWVGSGGIPQDNQCWRRNRLYF